MSKRSLNVLKELMKMNVKSDEIDNEKTTVKKFKTKSCRNEKMRKKGKKKEFAKSNG